MTRILGRLTIVVVLILAASLACTWSLEKDRAQDDSTSTTAPTRLFGTSTTPPTAQASGWPEPTPAEDGDVDLELTIVPYPTPADSVTPWTALLDPAEVESVHWSQLESVIQAATKGQQAPIYLSYPSDWIVSQPASHILSIQNEPPESFPEYQGPFVKFEVLWLREDPRTSAGLPQVKTVLISGERSILWEDDWYATSIVGALVQEGGTYYGVHGYINRVDDEQYRFYRSVILHMISSLRIGS